MAVLLMVLKSVGRLLKEETFERQVPLPAAAQAFHFSNRAWRHVARWWNRVERETWVKADLSIIFLASPFQTPFSVSTNMPFLSTEGLWLVLRALITDFSITLCWMLVIHLDWPLTFILSRLVDLNLLSEVANDGLFLCASVVCESFETVKPTGRSQAARWPSDAYRKHKKKQEDDIAWYSDMLEVIGHKSTWKVLFAGYMILFCMEACLFMSQFYFFPHNCKFTFLAFSILTFPQNTVRYQIAVACSKIPKNIFLFRIGELWIYISLFWGMKSELGVHVESELWFYACISSLFWYFYRCPVFFYSPLYIVSVAVHKPSDKQQSTNTINQSINHSAIHFCSIIQPSIHPWIN